MSTDSAHQLDCLSLPAWCPNCGEQGWQAHSEKSLQCKQCQFLYYHNVAVATSAIIETPQHYLMARRAKQPAANKLDFPGGFIEAHETAEQALVRELHEELQLDYRGSIRYLCNFTNVYRYADVAYHTLDLFFILPLASQPDIQVNDDVIGYEWVEHGEIPHAQIAFQSVLNACECYQRDRSGRSIDSQQSG